MSILSYILHPFTFIPSTFWTWICAIYFFILIFPILICRLLKCLLKHYRFSASPESLFCYSHVKLVIPLTNYSTLVIVIRHISITWHRKKPFITFRIHGLNVHVVQYNFLKDSDVSLYLNNVKNKLLADIKQKGLGAFYSFSDESKQQQYPFERLEGMVEDIKLRFTEVKTEFEKTTLINRIYEDPQQTFGDFTSSIPVIDVKVLCDKESGIGFLFETPGISFNCKTSNNLSHLNKVSLLITFYKHTNISLEAQTLDINLTAKELHKVVNAFVDYLNANSIFLVKH